MSKSINTQVIQTGGGGGGGTPGGSNTQVQFNDGGSFGGDAGFTYDKTVSGTLNLGLASTTAGKLELFNTANAFSSTIQNGTMAGDATITLPNATSILPIFGQQITFAGPTAARTITLPNSNFTVARTDAANTFTGVQTMTSPAITTSITTASASFTAFSGATTLLTIGGTGASASLFAPSTLDTSSSTTGAIRTSGGISAAKAGNIGTTLTVGSTIELGNASDTTLSRSSAGVLAVEGVVVPTISSTSTLTNKRLTKRAPAVTQKATPAINTDVTDVAHITGLAQAITSFTMTGTPVEGDMLRIDITDNGTARAIAWGASFESSGTIALPSTTVLNTRLDTVFVWNTVTSKWRIVGIA